MKFTRSGTSAKDTKAIDYKTNKKSILQKKKGVSFKLGKENKLQAPKKCLISDVLSERMAQGLNIFSGSKTMEFKEAKPIANPVLSFMDGSQNYFKRSFSMRARSSNAPEATICDQEMKTATIRRAFGKSLTSKKSEELSLNKRSIYTN